MRQEPGTQYRDHRKRDDQRAQQCERNNPGELLKLLQMRRPALAPVFDEALLRPTINKQFAEFFSRIDDGDEVALVPNRPTPPATPEF